MSRVAQGQEQSDGVERRSLEGWLGVNLGCEVGHSSLRRYVMSAAGSEHPPIDLPDWLEDTRTRGPVPESLRRVQSSVASSFSRGSASPISVQSARLFQ